MKDTRGDTTDRVSWVHGEELVCHLLSPSNKPLGAPRRNANTMGSQENLEADPYERVPSHTSYAMIMVRQR